MAIHYKGGDSVLPYKGPNMNKLIAAIFLALLAAGSISGCVVDDGRRGGGGPPGHMDHHGDGDEHGDDHRDRDDDHREHH